MIYFITSNKGKFEEAKKIVPALEMFEMELPEEQEVDQQKIVERKLEAASKLHENAHRQCSSDTLGALANGPQSIHGSLTENSSFVVEDTGFYLDCLPGLPGPLVKWFLQSIGRKGIYEICKRFDNFKAKGVSIIGYRDKKGQIKFFKGEVAGTVVLERDFESGARNCFGWDPVFVPEGRDETFAEMSRQEKNEISMRRKAFEELKEYIGISI